MPSAFGLALTGLKAFDIKLDVNANNIANVNTNNFKKSCVEMQEAQNGGVEVTISKIDSPGLEIDPNPRTGEPQQQSNVNVAEEFVDQMVARYAYEANILTIKTAEEMQKELLDIKA
jgi:flagellar basal-body rod protein FlgC